MNNCLLKEIRMTREHNELLNTRITTAFFSSSFEFVFLHCSLYTGTRIVLLSFFFHYLFSLNHSANKRRDVVVLESIHFLFLTIRIFLHLIYLHLVLRFFSTFFTVSLMSCSCLRDVRLDKSEISRWRFVLRIIKCSMFAIDCGWSKPNSKL